MSRLAVLSVFSVSILLALTACGGRVEDTRPGQPVKHRQDAFQALLDASEPIGLMLHDRRYDAKRLNELNEALAQARDVPWRYYGPDTDYPPSKSRPDVWREPEKWEAAQQRFFAAAAALRTAESEAAAQAAYDALRSSCKSCHDVFRR
ncbi:MAG: cytochrome c [Azoarcus sp.]|jgi:cytochrome c556|nr:cytochrome c [Azoarcus sp.]